MIINNIFYITIQYNMSSSALSESLKAFYGGGKTLIDDSKESDKKLLDVVTDIVMPYAQTQLDNMGFKCKVKHYKKISTYDCYKFLEQSYDTTKLYDITEEQLEIYKRSSMSPDGGILFVETEEGKKYPLLISEDKIQGSNDTRLAEGKKYQSTGNAIERAAKNINLAKTLSSNLDYFPYILFAAGCDFHHTETISMRLVQMNYLKPNYYIDIASTEYLHDNKLVLDSIIEKINISKNHNLDIATICVKAHQWNKNKHGSSNWTVQERALLCKSVVDQSIKHITKHLL